MKQRSLTVPREEALGFSGQTIIRDRVIFFIIIFTIWPRLANRQNRLLTELEGPPVASPSCKLLWLLIVLNLLCALSTVTVFSLELSLPLEQWETLSLTLAGFSAMK